MISEAEVQEFTQKIPKGWFYPEEIHSLYHLVTGLPDRARIVEVGVNYGRSASIYLQIGQHKHLEVHLVDNYQREDSQEARAYFEDLLGEFRGRQKGTVNCWWMDSYAASCRFRSLVDLLHVDGDHSEEGVRRDLAGWVPLVRPGGLACFHDHGVATYPWIEKLVAEHCQGWERVEPQYRTLAVRRKPG